jgi:hypothetical protein
MNTVMTPELREIIEAVHYRPAVSIIMPFEPKMNLKHELTHALKLAGDQVEKELENNYPDEMSELVMHKLKAIFAHLNFNTHKKSIAIYVSPVFEKVLYLDITVEQKILVDESFEIRDLVYSKKQMHKYLVLILSGKESKIYLGNSDSFVRIVSNSAQSFVSSEKDSPEKVANFSDPSAYKEVLMEKFLRHIDGTLDIILNAYQLPLFVLGTERTIGHFKNITKHEGAVIDYVHGNYEEATESELKKLLQPHISDWQKVRQKEILNKLAEAANRDKLVFGMRHVWQEAAKHKSQLLVVEKNFMYAAERGSTEDIIYKVVEPYNKFSYIKDAVDDVIEKVLEDGGDVEFVDNDMLFNFHHIALIKYY